MQFVPAAPGVRFVWVSILGTPRQGFYLPISITNEPLLLVHNKYILLMTSYNFRFPFKTLRQQWWVIFIILDHYSSQLYPLYISIILHAYHFIMHYYIAMSMLLFFFLDAKSLHGISKGGSTRFASIALLCIIGMLVLLCIFFIIILIRYKSSEQKNMKNKGMSRLFCSWPGKIFSRQRSVKGATHQRLKEATVN